MQTKHESAVVAFGRFFAQGCVCAVHRSFLQDAYINTGRINTHASMLRFGQQFNTIYGDSGVGFCQHPR